MKKNILVTGGAGFIGSHLVDRLVNLGHKVTIFDNLTTGLKSYINPKAIFIKGDITNKIDIENLFKNKFDIVCHLAGSASAINSFNNAQKDANTNFLGTINIVTKCLEKKVTRFLYASSMTTYGSSQKLPISERAPCLPISYYGISKFASERFVIATGLRVDLDFPFNATAFRMFNVYGPRQSLTNPYQGVMAIFIGNVLRKEQVKIFGDGLQSRDFIYIDDCIDIWIKSINKKNTFGKVFNVGNGKDISVNELTKVIIKTLGHKLKDYPVKHMPPRPGDQIHMRADIKSIQKALSWKPRINLGTGLEKTIKWALKNQTQKEK